MFPDAYLRQKGGHYCLVKRKSNEFPNNSTKDKTYHYRHPNDRFSVRIY